MFSAEIKVLCGMMNSVLTLHNVLLADSYFLYDMFQMTSFLSNHNVKSTFKVLNNIWTHFRWDSSHLPTNCRF